MKIAAAQTHPHAGHIDANLTDHLRLISQAADNGADLIVFPELSLTGYERILARTLALSIDDSRLEPLKEAANAHQMLVIVGAPILIEEDLFIGAFIIFPNGKVAVYTKQFLHDGEELFFKSSRNFNPIIEWKGERISLAICADIGHEVHAKQAKKNESTLYLASIFFTPDGITDAHNLLSGYAKTHSMAILMANYTGKPWEMDAAGRSAFWNKKGEWLSELETDRMGLLVITKQEGEWVSARIIDSQ